MKKEIITILDLAYVKACGKRIISGVKAGRELADLASSTFKGTRDDIIKGLVSVCQGEGSSWPKKEGVPMGFNNKQGDNIPEVMAFRSARVLLYTDLAEDGHKLTTEEKAEAKKAASEKAKETKETEKAAIVAETLKGVKELTPEIALQALSRMIAEKPLGTKERKNAENAINVLSKVFGSE